MSLPLKSPQQEAFAKQLALGKSKAEAYRIAYPSSQKWKPDAVHVKASVLASNGKVMVRVAQLQSSAMNALAINIERILRENAALAFSDVRQLFDENGSIKPINEWSDELAAAVASIEVVEEYEGTGEDRKLVGYIKKIKFWDKNAALDKLFKNFGMYAKDNERKQTAIADMMAEIAAIGRGLPRRGRTIENE